MEKGSRISVFRSGLVGPKFEPNLFLKQDLCVLFDEGLGNFANCLTTNRVFSVEWKGNWLIFQYYPLSYLFEEETPSYQSFV